MNDFILINIVLIWFISIVNLALGLRIIRTNSGEIAPKFLKVGDKAPRFHAETIDGTSITQVDFFDSDTFILFLSPTCAPCRTFVPIINELHPKLLNAGKKLVAVILADRSGTQQFINETVPQFPVVFGANSSKKIAKDYKTASMSPFFYCIINGRVNSGGLLNSIAWNDTLNKLGLADK